MTFGLNISFFPDKSAEKGTFSMTQDENEPFFPDQKRHNFEIVVKIIFALFKKHHYQLNISSVPSVYLLYLEDPP